MEPANEKKKKGGRPKKSITRERTTGIRLSITEYLLVKEKAQRVGLNLTTYIRQAAIEAKISSRLTAEEMEYVRQLVGFSNNINQIAKVCHQEGALRGMAYYQKISSRIDDLLKKLKL